MADSYQLSLWGVSTDSGGGSLGVNLLTHLPLPPFAVHRSNPELPVSDSDSSSDSEVTASQAVSRTADKLQAVRRFILSDPELHSQVLQYRPLVLSQLQEHLKAAGIRLGASKLLDFLDAQCITFTTAKPGQKAPSRRKRKKKAVVAMKVARAAAEGGARGRGGRKRGGAAGGPD